MLLSKIYLLVCCVSLGISLFYQLRTEYIQSPLSSWSDTDSTKFLDSLSLSLSPSVLLFLVPDRLSRLHLVSTQSWCKSLLVNQHWCVLVLEFTEHHLCVCPYFASYAQNVTHGNLISDKIKQDFFQTVAKSVLLYGCTTCTLMIKRLEKKLDGSYNQMLCPILNKSWKQHPTKYQLYNYLAAILQAI